MANSGTGDADVDAALRAGRGLVSTTRAMDCGIPRFTIRRLAKAGVLTCLAKGIYAETTSLVQLPPWPRFAVRTRAFVASSTDDAHACDFSAAALWRLPMIGPPPPMPRVLRPGSAHWGRSTTSQGKVRFGFLPPEARTWTAGIRVTDVAYTGVDVARTSPRLQGLIVADWILAHGVSREAMTQVADNLRLYKGISAAQWVIGRADGRSESALETAGRLVMLNFDLPTPVANAWVLGLPKPRRPDLLLPDHGIILEADGAVKYDNRPDAAAIVTQEKERDWELRSLGFDVLRFDWSLAVHRPALLAARIRNLMQQRRGRPTPTCWQLDPPWALANTATP